MNYLILFTLFCLPHTSAVAVELSQMGIKIDPNHAPAPVIDSNLKSNKILGHCDGKDYTSQAELDGCERNVGARLPSTYLSGESHIPIQQRPVPTTEQAK